MSTRAASRRARAPRRRAPADGDQRAARAPEVPNAAAETRASASPVPRPVVIVASCAIDGSNIRVELHPYYDARADRERSQDGLAHDTEIALAFTAALVDTGRQSRRACPTSPRSTRCPGVAVDGDQAGTRPNSKPCARCPSSRACWGAGEDEAVEIVDEMLREFHALPQLVRHDGFDYHVHATSPHAPLAERMAVDAAMPSATDPPRRARPARDAAASDARTCSSTCRRTARAASATPPAQPHGRGRLPRAGPRRALIRRAAPFGQAPISSGAVRLPSVPAAAACRAARSSRRRRSEGVAASSPAGTR